MAVTLITKTERLKWEDEKYAGAVLYYRRPTSAYQRELQSEFTENGLVREGEYLDALIKWSVVDWKGIQDAQGNEIPFDKDLVPDLPDHFKALYVKALYLVDPKEEELGN